MSDSSDAQPVDTPGWDADVIDGLTVADRTLGANIEKLAGLPLLFDPVRVI
mgnify:CR=1 FL=1